MMTSTLFDSGGQKEASMHRSIKAFVYRGDDYYVAECLEAAVVTQGKTLDETIANLREAVALHLEGEDPADFNLSPNPSLLVTMELEPAGVA
ncbi:MAG: type II toxin-antitoxin system HicB family antitoxin [Chloroflexota bacterium]